MTAALPPGVEMRTTSNGLPVVYVPYDHNTSVIADLAKDLGKPDQECGLCPAYDKMSCRATDCDCGYLVDPQWLPILILRGVKA